MKFDINKKRKIVKGRQYAFFIARTEDGDISKFGVVEGTLGSGLGGKVFALALYEGVENRSVWVTREFFERCEFFDNSMDMTDRVYKELDESTD